MNTKRIRIRRRESQEVERVGKFYIGAIVEEYDPEGDFGTYVSMRTRNTNGST